MFTEGLDKSALRWVREGSANNKEVPISALDQRSRIDPVLNSRSGSRSFGLPPPSKFRSGHLPPVSGVAIPVDYTGSASDNDVSSEESESDVYGGRYSLDSSPSKDHAPPHGLTHNGRHLPRQTNYTSEHKNYSDVNSSVEFSAKTSGRGPRRYSAAENGYTEEDSDSAASSDFSHSKVRLSEGYASSINSGMNGGGDADKRTRFRNLQNGKFNTDDDSPSAPPFAPLRESNQNVDQSAKPILLTKPSVADSISSVRKSEVNSSQVSFSADSQENAGKAASHHYTRGVAGEQSAGSSGPHPARRPTFHASMQGPWHSVLSYDACARLCLNAWARGCTEAPVFLENECALLRNAFGLQHILLQSEEEILKKRTSEVAAEGVAPKPKKMVGKMKVQVRKVRMGLEPSVGCSIKSLKASKVHLESARNRLSVLQTKLSSGFQALRRIRFVPTKPADGSLSRKSLAYLEASSQYIKQVSGLLKVGVTTLRNNSSSYETVQEAYTCLLRLKSSPEGDAVRMQPGSGETHVFFPDGLGDDLIVEVQDSKGKPCGRVLAQVVNVADDPSDKLRWWSIFQEPEHDLVGKIHLYINFSTTADENSHLKCGSVAETVAYDLVLEVAMKVQHFQQRNLALHGEWKWLLEEFASYYGVSEAYTKLRYLSYVMDVATPTADCLSLIYDLMNPVIMKYRSKNTLSHQENRILGEIEDQIEQILALVFENYKSLDESLLSGIMDVFKPAIGVASPALQPAVKLYTLLNDILTPEAQNKYCKYFQAASKKRAKRHLGETDEFLTTNGEGSTIDNITMSVAYQKMKALCLNVSNEVFTDIQIHNQHILPSFIDLPNLSASIYSVELSTRIREFLISCPPNGPSPPVAELVIAAADFERDLTNWNISHIKGGVDAKELFHLYIVVWIKDKRAAMLEKCKLDKVKWSGVRTQHCTTPFVDEMYDSIREMLNDYEVIICRWPEYTLVLENAIADIEKAIVEALDKQYSDVLAPLKDNLTQKKFGLKYVQKLVKQSVAPYVVPDELGILMNSIKRMLDVLRPKVEAQFKTWSACIPNGGNQIPGERLSEVTVMLRAKFRNYVQAIVEKLVENMRQQSATKLKKILQDSKTSIQESDVRNRMQPLKEQLTSTINHLHSTLETQVFIALCRGYWERMGKDVLSFLENRKENKSWYKGCTLAVSILDDTFASQMQELLGNSLQEKDVEPPRSIMEVRSMLCKDNQNPQNNTFYY
ncbi:hypothetical protein V2J09_016919 [Rumex salicifolius]